MNDLPPKDETAPGVSQPHESDREQYRRLKEEFAVLVDANAEERRRRLERIEREDPELHRELASLLEADGAVEGPHLAPVRVRETLGPYHLLECIGRGGMGEVYLAEQFEPVKRRVAIKLIRPGLGGAEIFARFEGERQALALMNHPSIARVLDAQTTSDGRPYVVMEYVSGLPITEYCDREQLSLEARIELFLEVLDGVRHAHQKGVLHRDLKPSNIMVSVEDGTPRVKIIDFGIAKALEGRLTDRTLHTEYGRVLGTPQYMSPEQAGMTPFDVDTRGDVYSLGVLFYELMTGVRPFEDDAGEPSFEALVQQLREREPVRPSARVRSLGTNPRTDAIRLAASRKTEASRWVRRLKGDLDWIALRALERDRERRYASVQEFAEDLGRHLRLEPVLAGPPSTTYRMSRFVRRHRIGVAAASVAILGVVAGGVAAAIGLQRALRAEESARAEARAAKEVAEFLESTFRVSDPMKVPGQAVTVSAVLSERAKKLRDDPTMAPATRSRLLDTLGEIYVNLGEYEDAELLAEAYQIRVDAFGPNHPETASTEAKLGVLRRLQGRPDDAEAHLTHAIEVLRDGPPEYGVHLAGSLDDLGTVYLRQGEYERAETSFREAIEMIRRSEGDESYRLVGTYNNLAVSHWERGQLEQTLPYFEKALAIAEKQFDETHPMIGSILNNIGALHWTLEEYDEAAPYIRRSVEIGEKVLEPDHPELAIALSNLGEIESLIGNHDEAEALFHRALTIFESKGVDELLEAHAHLGLGLLYHRMGRLEESEREFLRVIEIREARLPAEDQSVLEVWQEYGDLLRDLGRSDEADAAWKRAGAAH
ncbi:MAG: tetratricopeptide repeat protein [Candidatus Eisenbacteria bacterium]